MPRNKFSVVIMHGRDQSYKKIESLLKRMNFNPIVIKDNFDGSFLLKKVRSTVWDHAHCAVIVMTPDDRTTKGHFRARQNVVFELGYCLAAFDTLPDKYFYNAVIIVKEVSVENFSDIQGLETYEFRNKLNRIDIRLLRNIFEKTYKLASKYYNEL